MTESLTSLLVIFSEVGLVLLLLFIVLVFVGIRNRSKDTSVAKRFVAELNEQETGRKAQLVEILKKVHQMNDEEAEKTATTMLGSEKRVYNRGLRLFLRKNREDLPDMRQDVEQMASTYRQLVDKQPTEKIVERGDNPKAEAQLRSKLKQMTAERDKLQKDLDEAMQSMDNMLKEYTQMYEGGTGKKDGVKHLENELTQLKQKIEKNLVQVADDEEDEEGNVLDLDEAKSSGSKAE